MKNLILIRHGKSSWNAPLLDYERPLTDRGIRDAHLISQSAISILPKSFTIYSSSAKRASETAIIFAQNFSFPLESIQFEESLYTFDVYQLEHIVRNINNEYETVILFGHNAAITNFVNKFGDVYIENVPTSGLISFMFDCSTWNEIMKGRITNVLFPRDLKK